MHVNELQRVTSIFQLFWCLPKTLYVSLWKKNIRNHHIIMQPESIYVTEISIPLMLCVSHLLYTRVVGNYTNSGAFIVSEQSFIFLRYFWCASAEWVVINIFFCVKSRYARAYLLLNVHKWSLLLLLRKKKYPPYILCV